ncbi:MAG: hypothetical protein Q8K36_03090 [Alphaproteobacteria bacterium]|nr:hypothetical protein [Alphaproteobacteria bacterium]
MPNYTMVMEVLPLDQRDKSASDNKRIADMLLRSAQEIITCPGAICNVVHIILRNTPDHKAVFWACQLFTLPANVIVIYGAC